MRKLLYFLLLLFLTCSPAWAGVDFESNSDDKISFPSAGLNLNTGTICMTIKIGFDPSAANFNQWFDSDTARHAFFHNSIFNEVSMYNDGRTTNFNSATWTSGNTYSFCFVYNKTGNVQKFYIDGVSQTGDGGSGAWGSSALGTNVYIGCRFNQIQSIGSVIDNVAIWSSVLSDAEILQISSSKSYRTACQISPSTLLNYWELTNIPDGSSADGAQIKAICGSGLQTATVDNGTNNTGVTSRSSEVLSYP